MQIEQLLHLSEEEINRRIGEEIRKIPTRPGIGYLEQRYKKFQTPEWDFISYLAHYSPETLREKLEGYASYAGNESMAVIIEWLTEEYILGKMILEYRKKEADKK